MRLALLRVAALASRRLPPEWAEAARREADAVEGNGELARWTLGLVRLALPPARVWAGLVAAGAALAWLDSRLDSGLTALVALLLVAAGAGAATRRPLPAGLVVGAAIGAARVWELASGRSTPAGQPAGALGTAALFALVVPALVAAAAGAALRGRGRALR